MVPIEEYIKLMEEYRALKNLNLSLLEKIQPTVKKILKILKHISNFNSKGSLNTESLTQTLKSSGISFSLSHRSMKVDLVLFTGQNGDKSRSLSKSLKSKMEMSV